MNKTIMEVHERKNDECLPLSYAAYRGDHSKNIICPYRQLSFNPFQIVVNKVDTWYYLRL